MNLSIPLLLLVTIVACCYGNAIRNWNNRQVRTLKIKAPCNPYYEICGRRDAKVFFLHFCNFLQLHLLVVMGFKFLLRISLFIHKVVFWIQVKLLWMNPFKFNYLASSWTVLGNGTTWRRLEPKTKYSKNQH